MKTALLKDGIKEIKISYKRFISILLIVLLGVGFFAGLRASSPDMKKTLDVYFDEQNVMDIQVISTLGLTDDDIEAISKLENVEAVEGTYQTDAAVTVGDEEVIVKLETYSKNINELQLVEGRLPENENECVVETGFLENTEHSIGDSIEIEVENITNDDGEEEKVLKENKVTIVGSVKSPMYISTDRGSTKLGSGVINYYMYIPMENINPELYTNIYLTVKGAKELNTTSDEYDTLVQSVIDNLEDISEERREARYNELYDSANSKIQDAQKELDEKREEAEQELEKARKELEDGKKEIQDGRKEVETNRANANNRFNEAEKELENAKSELATQEAEFENTKEQTNNQIKEMAQQLETLEHTKSSLDTMQDNLNSNLAMLEDLEQQLEEATDVEKEEIQNQIVQLNIQIQTIQGTIKAIQDELVSQGITDIDTTIQSLDKGIETAKKGLTDGEKQIEKAKQTLENSEKELESTKSSTYYQLNNAEAELDNAEEEIKSGEKTAIEELYVKYQKLVINISFSIVKDKNIAEEISQMIFLKILQSPIENIPNNNELSWIYTITKNQTIDYLRKQHNDINIDTIYNVPDKNNKINEIIDRNTYNKMIDGLEEKEKEIVSLKVLTNFTFKEIGLILDMPTATVQWKYYKSVHTLKILLSNLSMFVITSLLYIKSRTKIEEKSHETDITNNTKQNGHQSIDVIEPSSIDGFATENTTTTIQSSFFSNKIEMSWFSISAIFLILTISFGIIFAKNQQKRHQKSSK